MLKFMFVFAVLVTGCAVSKTTGSLIQPVGATIEQMSKDRIECMNQRALIGTPLTAEEETRIGGVETGRFFEGGRGRNRFADRYFLCLLDHDYQWVEYPTQWLPVSKCELLKLYKSGGIEEKRLRYLCNSRPGYEECDICRVAR